MFKLIKVLRYGVLLGAVPLLGSCGGDDYYNSGCYRSGCQPSAPSYPYEVSLGVVAGNFNHNGHTSIIGTSTVENYPIRQPRVSEELSLIRGRHLRGAGADRGRQ